MGSGVNKFQYVYISYLMPGTNGKWGDCGCQMQAGAVTCYYVNKAGTMYNFKNKDFTNPTANPTQYNVSTETWDYTMDIMTLTKADAAGKWFVPYTFEDPETTVNHELMTFSLPINFDTTTGKCVLAVSVDVTITDLTGPLRTAKGGIKDVAFVDTRSPAKLFASSDVALPQLSYTIGAVPSPRIADLLATAYAGMGNQWRSATFESSKMTYQNVAVTKDWSLVMRAPVVSYAAPAAGALAATVEAVAVGARTMSSTYKMEGTVCGNGFDTPKNAALMQQFMQTVDALVSTGGARRAYMSYPITGSTTATPKWGNCGCDAGSCFFDTMGGTRHSFSSANMQGVDTTTSNVAIKPAAAKAFAGMKQANATAGIWQSLSFPSGSTKDPVLIYTIPTLFSGGNCVATASFEFDPSSTQAVLAKYGPTTGHQMVFIDARDGGTALSATGTTFGASVYSPTTTPSASLNQWMTAAVTQVNGTLYKTASLAANRMQINAATVSPNFAVFEEMSAPTLMMDRRGQAQAAAVVATTGMATPPPALKEKTTDVSLSTSSENEEKAAYHTFTQMYSPGQQAAIIIFIVIMYLLIIADKVVLFVVNRGDDSAARTATDAPGPEYQNLQDIKPEVDGQV
jgi:hypothetical protein